MGYKQEGSSPRALAMSPTEQTTPHDFRDPEKRKSPKESQDIDKRITDLENSLREFLRVNSDLATAIKMQSVQVPPPFTGKKPKTWLGQMESYFDLIKMPESQRLENIILHLKGEVLDRYVVMDEHKSPQMPKTWKEFKKFLIEYYTDEESMLEVIRKIKTIQFDGCFKHVVVQFREALAAGERPPEDHLVNLFLSRFPLLMVKDALGVNFDSWEQAAHFVQEKHERFVAFVRVYDELAPEEFRKEMREDPEVKAHRIVFDTPLKDEKEETDQRKPNFKHNEKYNHWEERSGKRLPEDLLVNLFLSRFPFLMVKDALEVNFDSWEQAAHFVQEKHERFVAFVRVYDELSPEEFRKEMREDPEVKARRIVFDTLLKEEKEERERIKPNFKDNKKYSHWEERSGDDSTGKGIEKGNGVHRGAMRCFVCSRIGHKGKDCFFRK